VFVFVFLLSEAAAWSAPHSMWCGSSRVYVVLRFQIQLCSPAAVLLWSWVFIVLDYWGLFLCLASFLWSKVSDTSAGPLLSECCDGSLIIFQFCNVV
jgi:hypothetical protein